MLFSIGLVSTFVTGGLTGIILADSALDVNVHDTYFVVAHFHVVMGLSAIFGMLAGVYHWFPKMYGRMMNTKLGYAHFWTTLVSGFGVFIPMHFVGLNGSPRRYYSYSEFSYLDATIELNELISIFAIIGGIAQLLFLFNFFYSIFRGQPATQNPWAPTPWNGLRLWPASTATGKAHCQKYTVGRTTTCCSTTHYEQDFVPQTVPLKAERGRALRAHLPQREDRPHFDLFKRGHFFSAHRPGAMLGGSAQHDLAHGLPQGGLYRYDPKIHRVNWTERILR